MTKDKEKTKKEKEALAFRTATIDAITRLQKGQTILLQNKRSRKKRKQSSTITGLGRLQGLQGLGSRKKN